jgi:hypothetical protein
MTSRIASLGVLAFIGGCGGQIDVNPDGGGNDGGTSDGSVNDATPPGPNCPVQAPNGGSSCMIANIQCEYGSDPRWTCNAVATCTGTAWTIASENGPTCPTTNDQDCPTILGYVQQGAACAPTGTDCNYSTSSTTTFCDCTNLGGPINADGGGAVWTCSAPEPSCPSARPHLGATCTNPGLECDYGICGVPDGLDVQCDMSTGTWVGSAGGVCAN